MGILDRLTGKRSSTEESEARAYVEAMIIMIAADGVVEDDEIEDFLRNVYTRPQLNKVPPSEMSSMIRRSLHAISTEGADARIRAIARMLPHQQQKVEAFRMCLSICASDGDVAPDELEILKKMQSEFDLSESQVEQIMNE
ncbi:MAG: tellurite resistance TerB family protein [Pyrinomonadaceae bacterium]|nr:tellurite resistance TerB family protein [Pyrinomonadaceae bacterium]